MNYDAVDFCSGGGGVGAAFVEEGLSYRAAVEFDPTNVELSRCIADIHDKNFSRYGCKLFRGTVQSAAAFEFDFIDDSPLIAHISPPCQNFSAAKLDAQEQERDLGIAKATIKFLKWKKPQFFTLEEVPGYLRSRSWEWIKQALIDEGYGITYGVLNALDYEVPQDRERLIVIADKAGRVLGMPARRPRLGWWDVLGDRIIGMQPSRLTETQQADLNEVLQMYPTTQAFLIQRIGKRNDKLKIRHQFEPCFTITKSMFSDGKKTNNGKGGSRTNFLDVWVEGCPRSLSIQDVAALQSFPEWYEFSGENNVDGALIGNSVPPNFYRAILQHILLYV